MDFTFGVVGLGRVGSSLVRAFTAAGLKCAGVYGGSCVQSRAKALGVPHFADCLELVRASDIIFICVPDRLIETAAHNLADAAAAAKTDLSGKYFYHVSGSAGVDVLARLASLGAETGSLHPLQSFSGVRASLNGIGMAADGTEAARALAEKLAQLLGAVPFYVPPEERAAYHAAACFCSNFTVTVVALAESLLARWTKDRADAHRLLMPLFNGTAENLAAADAAPAALTGPIARGDAVTVAKHLKALPQELTPVYKALARETVKLALERGSIDESAAAEIMGLLTEANK